MKNNLGSSRYVEDGSFLRLNTVSLKYDVPLELCGKLHVKKIAVTGSVRRLFVITKYSGQDPEVSIGNDFFWMGTDNAKTPPAQRYTLTFNVNF